MIDGETYFVYSFNKSSHSTANLSFEGNPKPGQRFVANVGPGRDGDERAGPGDAGSNGDVQGQDEHEPGAVFPAAGFALRRG